MLWLIIFVLFDYHYDMDHESESNTQIIIIFKLFTRIDLPSTLEPD